MFDVSDLQHEPPLISKCGSLEVTFSYIARKGKMQVTIHQAQEIPAKERGGANNTQVRLLLLPTKKQRHKTKVKQGDNPVFEESFVFSKISEGKILSIQGILDKLIVCCLTMVLTLFQFYQSCKCTFPCFPGVSFSYTAQYSFQTTVAVP